MSLFWNGWWPKINSLFHHFNYFTKVDFMAIISLFLFCKHHHYQPYIAILHILKRPTRFAQQPLGNDTGKMQLPPPQLESWEGRGEQKRLSQRAHLSGTRVRGKLHVKPQACQREMIISRDLL